MCVCLTLGGSLCVCVCACAHLCVCVCCEWVFFARTFLFYSNSVAPGQVIGMRYSVVMQLAAGYVFRVPHSLENICKGVVDRLRVVESFKILRVWLSDARTRDTV